MEFEEMVKKFDCDEISIGIEPALARQFFIETDHSKVQELFNEAFYFERFIVNTIWISQFISLIILLLFTILQFKWYSLIIIPFIIALFFYYQGKASLGKQSVVVVFILLFLTLVLAFSLRSFGTIFIIFTILTPLPFVFIRLTYKFSTFFMRAISIRNKRFFNFYVNRAIFIDEILKIELDEIIKLLIGKAEVNTPALQLIEECKKIKMPEIEYINFDKDPLYKVGYNFIFYTPDEEKARLEIIEIEGNLLQSGFQIIYEPKFFFSNINKHFIDVYKFLKGYYINELLSNVQGVEIYNFTNDSSQCYLSKSIVNGKNVLNFRITNKETLGNYN